MNGAGDSLKEACINHKLPVYFFFQLLTINIIFFI